MAYILIRTKHDVYINGKCVNDNYIVSDITDFGPQTPSKWTVIFTHPT